MEAPLGKSSPKSPPAPDPVATAAAQTASNKETAYWNAVLNNVNQFTPYGNITYQQEGDGVYNPDKPPQFTSTITLSPEQQAIYDTMVSQDRQLQNLGGQQISRIEQAVNQPYSFDGIGNEVREADVLQAQKNAEEAIMSRLTPQFGRDEEAMRTRLINQGITQGSEAYNREMEGFGQTKNDARIQALLAANQYGGDLQNQTLQRRNQGIQEYTTQRTAPLNEYIGFTSGTQVQNPQFQNISYGGAAPVDYAGLVNNKYQADMANYNARVAGRNSAIGGIFGLGGSLLSAGGTAGGFGNLFRL
jgi:hypothetical protein